MTPEDVTKLKDLVSAAVVCVSASAAWLTFSAARRDRHDERLYAELPVLNALEAELQSIRLMTRGEYYDTSKGERWFDPYYVHAGIRWKCVAAFPRSTAAQFFGRKLARLIVNLQAAIDRFGADLMRQHDSLGALEQMRPQLDKAVKTAEATLRRKLTLEDIEALPDLSSEHRAALGDLYRWNKELHLHRIGNVGEPGTIHHALAPAIAELRRARRRAGRRGLRWLFWVGHGLAVLFAIIGLWFLSAFVLAFVATTGFARPVAPAIPPGIDPLRGVIADTVALVAAPTHMARPWYENGLLQTFVGGLLAVLGGLAAQWFRGWLETQRVKAQLIRRVRSVLETTAVTARSTIKKDETHPINPETMEALRVEWERYDRLSDNLGLLGDPAFEERIDSGLAFARMVAEKVLEDERRFRETRRELGVKSDKGIQIDSSVEEGIRNQRKALLGVVRTMGDLAQGLLDRFNAKWHAESWHEQRRVPETTARESTQAPASQ